MKKSGQVEKRWCHSRNGEEEPSETWKEIECSRCSFFCCKWINPATALKSYIDKAVSDINVKTDELARAIAKKPAEIHYPQIVERKDKDDFCPHPLGW